MAWATAQCGVVQQLPNFLTTLPGGPIAFLAVTIAVFLILGRILEGLPAILLLAPIMFPIAKKLGIQDIHYSMVVVTAMNIGLMMPPSASASTSPAASATPRPTTWWARHLAVSAGVAGGVGGDCGGALDFDGGALMGH